MSKTAISDRAFELCTELDVNRISRSALGADSNDAVFVLLEEMLTNHCHELHLQQEQDFSRVRHRHHGKLQENRLSSAFLLALLEQLKRAADQPINTDCGTISMAVTQGEWCGTLEAQYYPAQAGQCLSICLHSDLRMAESLEQTSLTFDTATLLREHLCNQNPGIAMIVSDNAHALQTLYYTLLAENNSLSYKTVSIEKKVAKSISRVSQVTADAIASSIPVTSAPAYADHIFCDWWINRNSQFLSNQLQENTGRLSSFHQAASIGRAVRAQMSNGVDPTTLAAQLECLVQIRELHTLCPHCADCYQPTESELRALKPLISASRDQKTPLFVGDGCERCNHTGTEDKLMLAEIALVSDELLDALEKRSVAQIDKAIVSSLMSPSNTQAAFTAAKKGQIGFDQLRRLL